MKQQKRHKKPMSKIQDSLLRLFVFFCFLLLMVWVSIVEDKTLYNFYWLYISFAIIGLTIGIIRFVLKYKISCRQLQQWLWGVLYSFLHSLVAILVCVIVVCMFLVANYYIPTNNPYYNKTATVISKYTGTSKVGRSHYVKFNFEDNKIGLSVLMALPSMTKPNRVTPIPSPSKTVSSTSQS